MEEKIMFRQTKSPLNTIKEVIIALITVYVLLFGIKANAQSSTYVILTSVTDTVNDPYYQTVQVLRNYRGAQVVKFNPENIDQILPTLTNIAPRYVAILIKPIELHINFVRKFLMMSTKLDADPFSDFSYGFITGATASDALNFVNKIIYAESHNIKNFPLNIGGYSASSLNFVYSGSGGYLNYLNPPSSHNICMITNNSNSGHNFFMSNTSYMENNKMLDIGHNGDPHMLWLFEGGNTNPIPPVWNYDSTKIENPAYARTGLSSYDIATLNLYPAVAFNGACHSGEPKRVMVEGDIAATFGETQGYTQFYTMSDTFSFALSILKTGITGYFAPCGANNANDQGEDVYNAFLYQEPLGDIHKRSNDGVVMGFLGNRPNLKLFTQGGYGYGCDVLTSGTFNPSQYSGACYMLGGKANRIYFGDPLFNPYELNHSDSLNITKAIIDSINPTTLDIFMTFKKPNGFWPVWDKFHHGNTRIYIPVKMPSWCNDITDFKVIDSSGIYNMVIHAVEKFEGKTILHIEVDIPNDIYAPINYNIKFRVKTQTMGISPLYTQSQTNNLKIYPNPSNGMASISYELSEKSFVSLNLYDITGKLIKNLYTGELDKGYQKININNYEEINNGIYYITLDCNELKTTKKLFIIK